MGSQTITFHHIPNLAHVSRMDCLMSNAIGLDCTITTKSLFTSFSSAGIIPNESSPKIS